MKHRMSKKVKIITVICIGLLAGVIFLPLWKIELSAPQYPEGLVLKIYPGKLGGDIEVVNGLNHYIGMRTLHTKDFVEFTVLPYIIGILCFFGIVTLWVNRKWFFIAWAGFFLLFALISMIDFYRWEYNYGHNLDPAAPIQVPGMSYQPPLIGFKQLLNFGAYSIPDWGGWLFMLTAVLLLVSGLSELLAVRKGSRRISAPAVVAMLPVLWLVNACQAGPQAIRFGEDACDFCKMTISDHRFGAELVTKKGKLYKFDDAHCILSFLQANTLDNKEIAGVFLVDYTGKGRLTEAGTATLLSSDELHSPMGGNIAAFGNRDSAVLLNNRFKGTLNSWNELTK